MPRHHYMTKKLVRVNLKPSKKKKQEVKEL